MSISNANYVSASRMPVQLWCSGPLDHVEAVHESPFQPLRAAGQHQGLVAQDV